MFRDMRELIEAYERLRDDMDNTDAYEMAYCDGVEDMIAEIKELREW